MIRTRYLQTYCDGFRLWRLTLLLRCGRARGRSWGLGLVWRNDPCGELTATLGPWAMSVTPAGYYAGPMDEILDHY